MKNNFIFIALIVFTLSCNDNRVEGPTIVDLPYIFEDGFESPNIDLDDLFPEDASRWTNIQQVNPSSSENDISLNQTLVLEGSNSLELLAQASDDILSKMDIQKGGIFAPEGSKLFIEANFYMASENELTNLLLIDIECCTCWDPSVSNNQCPGIRLMFTGENDYLSIERGKIGQSTIFNSTVEFPRNEWVHVEWNMTLSSKDDGENMLFINDVEAINIEASNLPNAEEFKDIFADEGIDFELQEPLGIERVQIGATANPTENAVHMYIDDFKLRIE